MKLKCDQHDRRVLSGQSGFLHRTGDQSKCTSTSATIGTRTYAIKNGELQLLVDTKYSSLHY